jgi:putative SOS response-associated peptidase YedK
MCSNYRPVTRTDRLLTFFGVERDRDDMPDDVYPSGLAPFIRLAADDGSGSSRLRVVDNAIFRFVPDFIAKVEWARNTFNVRSETVATKTTYRDAWEAGQRCIIPAEMFYEHSHEEPGPPMRWAIYQPGTVPMGIAGVYRAWKHPDGRAMFAISMLTVNSDEHPLLRRFHRPGEEKRTPVVLDPENYTEWLTCPVDEAHRFLRLWHGPLESRPAPAPARVSTRRQAAPPPPQGDLFS